MLYQTPAFFLFFALFLIVYLPFKHRIPGRWILLAASQVFYAAWDIRFLWLLWMTILCDFWIAFRVDAAINGTVRRIYLVVSLVLNIGVLVFFKYWNLLAMPAGQVLSGDPSKFVIENLIIPIGVSFYTFQSLSYVFDVYRRVQRPILSLIDYAAFVSYFPQLVMGPICRLKQLAPQIINPQQTTVSRVIAGSFLFIVGFFRKSVGDVMGIMADSGFNQVELRSPTEVTVSLLAFWLQVYLDFSGYTDMARGVSRIIGIELPINFRTPYLATSIRDFWRRWHITLSDWLRDYVYFSLGGSRKGLRKTLFNIMIVMLLSALWHGAGINFVIFGLLHGTFLCAAYLWSHFLNPKFKKTEARPALATITWSVFCWFLTMSCFIFSLIFFKASTPQDSMLIMEKLAIWLKEGAAMPVNLGMVILIILLLSLEVWQYKKPELLQFCRPFSKWQITCIGALSGLLFSSGLILFAGKTGQPFIYFQF